MAKKKKRKEDKTKKFKYTNELYGVVFILLAILGIGIGSPLGIVGKLVKAFSVFLFGTWNIIFMIGLFLIGLYMVIKREKPSFFTSHLVGFYIIFIGILVYSHLNYVSLNGGDVVATFEATANDLMSNFNAIMDANKFNPSGGGMLGCLFAVLFNKLFDASGTKIVAIVLIVTGTGLFTGVSIFDFIRNGYQKGKDILPKHKEKVRNDNDEQTDSKKVSSVIINDNNITSTPDNKLVISSIDELTHNIEKSNNDVEAGDTSFKPAENKNYKLPPISLLKPPAKVKNSGNQSVIEKNIITLETVLKDFGIIGKVVEVNSGPSVTQYELEVQSGTKLNKILSINREISLALAKKDVRIQAPIPGKSTVGIEIANDEIRSVSLREILETSPSNKANSKLLVALGKNIMGRSVFAEIDKMPHLLVAGATGSGKSVCINCIIASMTRKKLNLVCIMVFHI